MKELENRINSVELCELINQLRKEEKGEGAKVLLHKSLMEKIRRILKGNDNEFKLSSYINSQNKEQPCFSLNVGGLQKLLGISKFSADTKGICECIKRLGGNESVVYSLNREETEFDYCL